MILENHKILALDQSLASTAYTIIDTNSELSSFGKVTNTKTTKHIEAMRNVRDEIKKIILENDIKLVVLEDTYCGVNNILIVNIGYRFSIYLFYRSNFTFFHIMYVTAFLLLSH